MKATLSFAIALTTLTAIGGQALAADNAHEGYQRGFYGKHAQDDSAAAPVTAKDAFVAPRGGTRVLTDTGVRAWDKNHGPVNKVVSSGAASATDGHEGYRRGFAGRS